MNKLQIAKTVVTTVVGIGTGKIVHDIISNNSTPVTITDKVFVTAGSYALGTMIADVTRQYTDASIDQIVAQARKLFKK